MFFGVVGGVGDEKIVVVVKEMFNKYVVGDKLVLYFNIWCSVFVMVFKNGGEEEVRIWLFNFLLCFEYEVVDIMLVW